MAVEFTIPKLGDNITEATIVSWLVDDGAEVAEGDDIVELETDKAVVPAPATAGGIIKFGNFKAGDVVEIDQVVATIETQNGDTTSADTPVADSSASSAADTSTAETDVTTETSPEETRPEPVPASAGSNGSQMDSTADDGVKITPVARKIAQDKGVNLSSITGSGDLGKITKDDVLQALSDEPESKPDDTQPAPPQPEAPAKPAVQPKPDSAKSTPTPEDEVLERHPLKGIRGVIARRMAESVQTTARVTLVTDVDATELVSLREQLKGRYAEAWGFAPGYNDLLAMIVAGGLRQFPYMNARFSADGASIEYLKPVNLGLAVDTDRGLLVTVIRDADHKGLQEIGSKFRELAKKARAGKAGPDELSGSTFTISSLGIFRVDAFTPVINLPEAAILGVGRIHDKPVVKDGEIVVRKMMTLSLVFDHRLTDGAPAARFLDYICELIEEPYLLFLTRK